MRDDEKSEFSKLWLGCHEVFGSTVTPSALRVVWGLLRGYDMPSIREALKRHMASPERGQYAPKPADIIREINATKPQHIGADEAWAVALSAADESATVVWTRPIETAWHVALPIYANGDAIGARMAFRDAYNREVATAQSPHWYVSAGWDVEGRAIAVQSAAQQGRLSADEARAMLPATVGVSPGIAHLAGLIAGKAASAPERGWADGVSDLKAAMSEAERRIHARENARKTEREQRAHAEEARRDELVQQAEGVA